MGNFRNKLKEKFSQIPNELIFDNSLTDRARFVYVYMASKPSGWNFYLNPMAKELGYSVETLRKYLNELVAYGWLTKGEQQIQVAGRWGAVEYVLEDEKIPTPKNTDAEKTRHGEKNSLSNTDSIQIQISTNIDYDKSILSESENLRNEGLAITLQTQDPKEKSCAKKESPKRAVFTPPNVAEVETYCKERNNGIDANYFVDYYTSNGWMVGRTKMKDWKAAVRNWERNSSKTTNKQQSNGGISKASSSEIISAPQGYAYDPTSHF